MERIDDSLLLSASDLINYLECRHLTQLDREVASGVLSLTPSHEEMANLVSSKGEEHEVAYLERLIAEGREIAEIAYDHETGASSLREAAERTRTAMRDGPEIIYQAVLFDGDRWRGYADFLERVERPSDLGVWSYEVADTKLARRVKPYYLIQLCFYSELLAREQGREPEQMHVVLGTLGRESFPLADFAAYYRSVRNQFLAELDGGLDDTYPDPVEHCPVCRWNEHCQGRREADDHLSVVANMRRDQTARLNDAGISTVEALAGASNAERPPSIAPRTFKTLRSQAELQVRERTTRELHLELLEPEPERGFARLPEPAEGDLFFDIEGDPFFEDGLEYLFGIAWRDCDEERFRAFWATDRASEKRAFEELMDFFAVHLESHPGVHIYHYAPYEPTALKRLMGLHATREDDLDELLRSQKLIDLYAVVRQGIRVSRPGYSLKDVEAFYLPRRDAEVTEGGQSIVEFERYLDSGDDSLLAEIENYNREDCISTLRLRDWLLGRREEAIDRYGALEWRPAPEPHRPDPEVAAEVDELQAALLGDLPDDPEALAGAERTLWLFAQLLDYHRREEKPAWWEYFRRLDEDDESLIERDAEALGGLESTGAEPLPVKRSLLHEMRYPAQEHRIGPGQAVDPKTEGSVNVESVDEAGGLIQIRRGADRRDESLPRALIPGGPYDTRVQRAALRRLARDLIDRGLDASGRYSAMRDVLRREPSRTDAREASAALQEDGFDLDEAKQIVSGLEGSYLFIQGPPGSGKTYSGAHLILRLIAEGKRVGVSSNSHKAINNLLGEIERVAVAGGIDVRGLKKGSGEDRYQSELNEPLIANSNNRTHFLDPELNLVAGTAWLLAREEFDGALDFLFLDEAGQISLADALAIGTAAENLVLLGDPLQLAQVTQAVHPPGSGVSVLEHLLRDERTIPRDRGLFIDRTRRMHPDVCRFVSEAIYDGRLSSVADCEGQRVDADGELTGTGVRWLPVEHEANTRSSTEEGDRIAEAIEELRDATYTRADGETGPLPLEEIMVVAPYNAQVRCLRNRLPEGVRIGTVDKFQGQEAAIVFFSMATSSGAEIPRNVEFLFSRNRLNVAVSRARCLAVLVCSPALLHTRCRSAEQVRLVNALCRLVEFSKQ